MHRAAVPQRPVGGRDRAVMGKNDGAIKALQHRAVKRLASVLGDELR